MKEHCVGMTSIALWKNKCGRSDRWDVISWTKTCRAPSLVDFGAPGWTPSMFEM